MSLISRGKEIFFFNDEFTEIITKREESLIFFFPRETTATRCTPVAR